MSESITSHDEFKEENDLVLIEQRLEEFFVLLPFLQWLDQPDEFPQIILDKIQHFDFSAEIDWDFTDTQPAVDRLTPKQQRIAHAFIDFFQKKVSYNTLVEQIELHSRI